MAAYVAIRVQPASGYKEQMECISLHFVSSLYAETINRGRRGRVCNSFPRTLSGCSLR